jgi:hypothetical protein
MAWWSKDKKRRLKHVKPNEFARLVGNDWLRVWTKLKLTPTVSGSAIVGELRVRDTNVVPIIGFTGYSDRADVVMALMDQLGLSGFDSEEFLECRRGLDFVVEQIERNWVQMNDADEG